MASDPVPDNKDAMEPTDDRPSMGWLQEGLALSQRVLVVALSLALPVLAGAWFDGVWPMGQGLPIGVLIGSGFGMLTAAWQLWRLTHWLAYQNLSIKRSPIAGGSKQETDRMEENHRDAPGP